MNDPDLIRKQLFSKSNGFVLLGVYFASAIYFSSIVLSENNLAAPDLSSKILLLLIVLFIASPGFAVGSLAMKLRIQHLIKTKNIYEFIMPTKGSLGHPDLSIYMGDKIKIVWRYFIIFFLVTTKTQFLNWVLTI